jgi:predicted transcriptional regulator
MPIDLDSHNISVDLTYGTMRSDLVVFLYAHSDAGFTPVEISQALDATPENVETELESLHETGHIGKTPSGHYHALATREILNRYVASIEQTKRMFRNMARAEDTNQNDISSTPHQSIDDAALASEVESLESELENELG